MKKPSVTFVILNWNQANLTLDCLKSVFALDYPNFKVIIIDNGSKDNSPDVIRQCFPLVKVIETGKNLGYSAGNNLGIKAALEDRADYIMLLNNDTEVERSMLSHLVEISETYPDVGIIGPTIYYAKPNDVIWSGANYIKWQQGKIERRGMGNKRELNETISVETTYEADSVDTCAALVKREVLEKVGLMNDIYFINGVDHDLSLRIRKAGYKVVYLPEATVWHKVSAAIGQASAANTYYMTRNHLIFFWQNAPGVWKFLAPIQIILRTIRTITAWTIKSEYQTEAYRRRRQANLMALRDFLTQRFGMMGADVSDICFGNSNS
jgi:GT2 family glycosyltransferase